ncbi:Aminoacyl-tRNA synthetase class II [Penicillium cf. griseofulvum]|uniref:Aminoacyl-tRNA synthetase class II n=1 Tax=Penicillium cf. griseofulvum TaxID=2972120 RepID=A0A9W9J0L6_9EURO|nr:Aminoacyl-tRNA synthetase class II [Penicillium cf. griseofulvum]
MPLCARLRKGSKFAGFRALVNDGTAESPRPLSSVDSTFLYNLIFILGSRDLADGGITVDVTGQMQSKTDKDAQVLQALIKARLGNDALKNPRAVKLRVEEVHPLLVELEKNFV